MSTFHYQNNTLFAEEVSIAQLASTQPTPFYCYSSRAFSQHYQQFKAAFASLPNTLCYAMKANSNQAVLTLLAQQGAGADVVSLGELQRAIAAGFPAEKIVFSGVAKSEAEITAALELNIHCFNVESEPELRHISSIAQSMGKTAPISLRINPDVDPATHAKISTGKSSDKFGIPLKHALAVYQLAAELPAIDVCGIDMHIGSQITKLSAYDEAIGLLVTLSNTLKEQGIAIKHFNFGGGLGVAYKDSDSDQQTLLAQYAEIIKKHALDLNCHYIFEPGRFIAANAGILVTQVRYVKPVEEKCFVIVDAAMNDLIRPTLYEAYHQLANVEQANDMSETKIVDVVGPVCETGDYLALNRELAPVKAGDLLVLHSAGAYGAVQSSSYNSRPLISEVLVNEDKWHCIRQSPSIEELIAQDSLPNWL
jgi:diaminopimelate decarboxylase